jgi:hypothetical protein
MGFMDPEKMERNLRDASLNFNWEVCPLGYRPHYPSIALESLLDSFPSDFHNLRNILLKARTN